MARSRNIKPGFFRNEHLAECSPLARLLFIGLWCEADRDGRLEDRPKRLKVTLLPYDDCSMHDLMMELVQKGFIIRYSANGLSYIQITNFLKHQQPHHKEAASVIPAPIQTDSHAQDKHDSSMVQASVNESASCPLDSLIPSTLIPSKNTVRLNGARSARFDEFWKAYPKAVGKKPCMEIWKRKRLDDHADEIIRDVTDRSADDAQWLRGFIPNPQTYLSQERWNDSWNSAKLEKANGVQKLS